MLKRLIRQTIKERSSSLDALLTARGLRKHFSQTFSARQNAVKRRLFGVADPAVMSGPFAGMTYLNEVVWGPIEPKWLGTYERELHPIVEEILRTGYDTIIDVGSAEGFYSVGFARALPGSIVHSFDVDPWARAQQRRLARLNGVTNIRIGGRCDHPTLQRSCRGRTLLLCDIEGHEYDLLDRTKARALGRCDILVEMHPDAGQGLGALSGASLLARRFAATHGSETIAVEPRTIDTLGAPPFAGALPPDELLACVDERRSFAQCWLWMRASAPGQDDAGEAASRPTRHPAI